MTQITKVRLPSATRTEIAYSEQINTDLHATTAETQVSSDESRDPDFTDAANKIAPLVKQYFKMPEKWEVDFRSISYKRNDDGLGACISVYVSFPEDWKIKQGYSLITPLLTEDVRDTGWNKMPIQLYEAITALMDQAQAFLGGKRAQQQLFSEEEQEAA